MNERQHGVLEQLRTGVKLQPRNLERQFEVGEKKAKRDLSDLAERRLIAFERTPRPGHYRLAIKPTGG